MSVVTRFAPSPTGSLHVGGLRTALYNYIYAKKMGGKFILRIEDTDEARSTDDSLKGIVRDLQWAKIDWDEGPSKNPDDIRNNQVGSNGPYFQSQRKDIYNAYIDQLLKDGLAYEKDGAIVFAMPKEEIVVNDIVLGDVKFPASQCQDLVIRKSTGMPTFHFAVVIDDATMGVTHIMRGQEHLQNCWKHISLQRSLKLPTPQYGHIPLIFNPNGSKMSKRQTEGQVNTLDFRKDGYLYEVMLNYLALLGWNPGKDVEKFDVNYMIEHFDIKDIGKASGRFDYKKLANFNATHIQSMAPGHFFKAMSEFVVKFYPGFMDGFASLQDFMNGINLAQPRCKTLADFPLQYKWLTDEPKEYKSDKTILDSDGVVIKALTDLLGAILQDFSSDSINQAFVNIAKTHLVKTSTVSQAVRLAVTGGTVSPPINETLLALGRTKVIGRLSKFINMFSETTALV